ncbi:MAG TPA: hypothetical protein VEM76_19460 [Anaeromyxobacteraceae bacterium]|nr:hypothetical protein [Anaeromyxobacteraceae bacterium]
MNRLLALLLAVAFLAPAAARAQVGVNIQLGLPAAPPMVVIQPGVQVVENYDEEVFFSGGWYWVRRDGRWWRARQPRAAFVYVEPRRVPPAIVRLPPGQYRHWNHEKHQAWKAERRAEKQAWKADKHAWKAEERHERHERERDRQERHEREHEHGHHDGR